MANTIKLKEINSIVTIIGIATAAFEIMMKTFKWYEKIHGKNKGVIK